MLSLTSYEHIRRSDSVTFHLVLVSFGEFQSVLDNIGTPSNFPYGTEKQFEDGP